MQSMKVKQQFSVRYFFVEVLFVCLGLGFLTVLLHAPMRMEFQLLVIPIVGACWGTAIGGVFDNWLEGAKAGLVAGFGMLLLCLAGS
jgi:hypothetical protein